MLFVSCVPEVAMPSPRGPIRLITISAAAATVAVVSATALAPAWAVSRAGHASAFSGWRIVLERHYGKLANFSMYDSVAAASRSAAWVLGGTDAADPRTIGGRPVGAYWNGRRWSPVPLPVGLGPLSGFALAASGRSDAWAVSNFGGYVMRWNGSRWVIAKRFRSVTGVGGVVHGALTGVTILSRTDVWVFGGQPFSYPAFGTWHYNGRGWTKVGGAAAGLSSATAASATEMWAVGTTGFDPWHNVIAHYQHGTWRRASDPALTHLFFGRIVAAAGDVWVGASTADSKPRPVLLRRHLGHWAKVAIPWRIVVNPLAPDGHGGIWFAGASDRQEWLVHRTAAGSWTRTLIPHGILDLGLVPGTTSFLGVGDLPRPPGTDAVIFARGRLQPDAVYFR
jgi:hypothetical protein